MEVKRFEVEKYTDVLHAEFAEPRKNARIDVFEVGATLGFPGQVLARVDSDSGELYGVTIENYSGWRRKALWRFRLASVKSVLNIFASGIAAGLSADRDHHRKPEYA